MAEMNNVKKVATEAVAVMANPSPAGAGDLIIHEGAVATIIKRAALSVKGVSRFAGSSFVDNIAEIVRSKKIQDRSIALRLSSTAISMDLSLYAFWGATLPQVASEVKSVVSQAVLDMTGIPVDKININFRGMDEETAQETEQGEQE
ncbi:MAG: Asp23/Gls24 family envelope stress response protein [Lentisphaeria bacterium]|nr:Asp23/Gls24 family envelope stress response protein [Lentisphaeria bacterium]